MGDTRPSQPLRPLHPFDGTVIPVVDREEAAGRLAEELGDLDPETPRRRIKLFGVRRHISFTIGAHLVISPRILETAAYMADIPLVEPLNV